MYNSGVWLYFDISVFRVHMCAIKGVWFILIFKCFVSFPLFTTDEIQKKTNKLLY